MKEYPKYTTPLIISKLGGILVIIGGALSIYGLYKSSFNTGYQLIPSLSTVVPLIILNLSSGILIIISKSQWSAFLLAINFVLQSIQFKLFGLYYFFAVGPYFGAGIVKNQNANLSFWHDSSEFVFTTIIRRVDDTVGFFFTVNFVALFFLTFAIIEYKNRKNQIITFANTGV